MTPADYIVVSLAVFGTGGIVLLLLSRLFRDSAKSQDPAEARSAKWVSIGVVAWALVAVSYALFVGLSFSKLAPMMAVPWLAGVWFMFSSTGSSLLRATPVHRLISLSFYRVVGIIFLYCYYVCGTLSRGFALNAGWGDVLTGVLAIPVAMMVKNGTRYSHLAFALWTLIGIGDLILAPASAAMYGAKQLTNFPINLIPLFLGPPFGILLHLITVRAYWLQHNDKEVTRTPLLNHQSKDARSRRA